jgi:hypothetical protein
MTEITRRALLQSASAGLLVGLPQTAGAQSAPAGAPRRAYSGWEHYRGTLGGAWEVWRGKASDNVTWCSVFRCAQPGPVLAGGRRGVAGQSGNQHRIARSEMYNGRAIIRVNRKGCEWTIAVASKGLPAAFLRLA